MMAVENSAVSKVREEALKKIKVTRIAKTRIGEIDFNNLIFGKKYADHMLVADFDGKEWKNAEILPFGHLSVSPSNAAWHYGQAIFEGI